MLSANFFTSAWHRSQAPQRLRRGIGPSRVVLSCSVANRCRTRTCVHVCALAVGVREMLGHQQWRHSALDRSQLQQMESWEQNADNRTNQQEGNIPKSNSDSTVGQKWASQQTGDIGHDECRQQMKAEQGSQDRNDMQSMLMQQHSVTWHRRTYRERTGKT